MKESVKNIIGTIVFLAVIIISIALVVRKPEEIRPLLEVNPWGVALLFIITIFAVVLIGYKLKIYTKHYNLHLTWDEWLHITSLTRLYNLVIPIRGGAALRAAYMKKFKQLKIASSLTIHVSSGVISLLLYGALTLLFALIIGLKHNLFGIWHLIIVSAAAILIIAAAFLTPTLTPRTSRIYNYIVEVANEWYHLRKNYWLLARLIFIEFLIWAQFVIRYYIEFRMLGAPITLLNSMVIGSFVGLASLINILPAGIGIRETVITVLSTLGGTELSQGLIVALIDRAIIIITTVVMAVPAFLWLRKKHLVHDTAL